MGAMTHLIEALRIMDEKGRRAADHHSYMLWEKEWGALRHEIIEAVFVASPQPADPADDNICGCLSESRKQCWFWNSSGGCCHPPRC